MATASTAQDGEIALWISLSLINGVGGQTLCKLLSAFGTPDAIYNASVSQLKNVASEAVTKLIAQGPDNQAIQPTLDWLAIEGNHLITLADSCYPKLLLEIADPPPLLYAKGNLDLLNMPSIAIVGSRNASPQGAKNAEDFACALSELGFCIVSGMALGIDGSAHIGALKGSGNTIAVVGTGLDIVYPAKHRDLAHQIAQRGLIISEFGLNTPSRPQNFPRRNRIISGLSLGCLVVEANIQSGSLITARLATEQGREVFAIPGSIHSPVSKGCHSLIKQGAKLVDHVHDIVSELQPFAGIEARDETEMPPEIDDSPILTHMGFDPINIETLIERSGLTSEQLSAMLLVLELENKVATLPGGRYQRIA
ncbi:MAG: DNA-processing protein DprA [Methylophilaceae bacterium]|nr:DNA-processing protein DprA [Methyloradius sp.]